MKKLFLIMASAVVLSILAGCGQSGEVRKDTVEITVVSPFDEKDGNRIHFVNAYQEFEAVSGFAVKDEAAASNEEWKKKITEDFQTGKEPDILFYFTGPDADELIRNDKVVSMGDIRKAYPDYASNMKDSMMPVSTFNGRQYAVPVNGYWENLFVNKKVLEACGLDLSGTDYTWDQFLEDCRIIRDKGYTPIACSLMEIPHYWFEYCTFNNGSIASHLSLPASSGDNIGMIWTAGLKDIKTLYDEGFFPENTITAPDEEINLLMTEDKAAFMIDGSWKVGWFQANAAEIDDFSVTFVPAKGVRKPTEIIGGFSMGYYITKKAWDDPKKQEACVEFVKFMTTDDVVSSFGALSFTALKNETSLVGDVDSLVASVLDMSKNCTGVVSAAQDMLAPSARGILFANVKNIVAGEIAPETAIEQCLAEQ